MSNVRVRGLIRISLFVGLMVICSWIAVPFLVPFTLQTFGVFLAAGVLGGKRAAVAVLVYILLGIIGLPVFFAGRCGIGALFDFTGGYIVGFAPCAYVAGVLCEKAKERPVYMGLSMIAGLVCDYVIAIAWNFSGITAENLLSVISLAVLPFLVPDFVKIVLACLVALKIKKHIRA